MEVTQVSVSPKVLDSDFTSAVDGGSGVQLNKGLDGSEAPGDDLLHDLDSYMDDIKERLTISRMVSDSVIRGVVRAVEHEAADRITAKELEVAAMKAALQSRLVNADKNEAPGFQVALKEHGTIRESLTSLGNSAKEQLKKLKKEIRGAIGCDSIRKISSSSSPDSLPFRCISCEKAPERWIDIEKMLQTLKTTLNTTYSQLDSVIYLPTASLSQWQQEQELQGEAEAMVTGSPIQSLQKEFDDKFGDHKALCLYELFVEISNIRQELNTISKLLSSPEVGHLTTHGYQSSEERNNNAKRIDNLHQDSKISLPESLESSQLMHMSKEDLYKYFKAEMTKLKRNHESEVLLMTEENFGLKRELFKERESSLPLKKDKDFENMRKKIPEIVLRLERILLENEKLLLCSSNAESLGNLRGRLQALLLENRQLKDLVENKKREVKCLSSSVSDAEEKISQQTLAEADMVKMTGSLMSAIADVHIEALVREEVYDCILKELIGRINTDAETFNLEISIMQEIYESIFREVVHSADVLECGNEALEMESAIMHGLCTIIFREALRDAVTEFGLLKAEFVRKSELLVSLELETERALSLDYEEIEKLNQEMHLMEATLLDKDELVKESLIALEKERELLNQVSPDLHSLRAQARERQTLVINSSKELDLMKREYNDAAKRIDICKEEIGELNQKLELEIKQSREICEERRAILDVVQEERNIIELLEQQDLENRKNLESIRLLVSGSLKNVAAFECGVTEALEWFDIRLQSSTSQLQSLNQKADTLRRTRAVYKKSLEQRCLDLQKAEAEVDLLGDEVDTLSSLLEKIYIALDHYSPILQHYPGIMEILKMIRRELSVGSLKRV